jgi:hypothetical protein
MIFISWTSPLPVAILATRDIIGSMAGALLTVHTQIDVGGISLVKAFSRMEMNE